jgi:hypothetical protein
MHRVRKEVQDLLIARQPARAGQQQPQRLIDLVALHEPALALNPRAASIVVTAGSVMPTEEI